MASEYEAIARQAAERYGVDPDIFVRQMMQESGLSPYAHNEVSGATGIAQFMPATAAQLGVNPHNPIEALDGAARLMAQYLNQYNGDYRLALAAYNAGPGNVQQHGGVPPFAETQTYINNILGGSGMTTGSVIPNPFASGGGGSSLPSSAQVVYNGQGQAFRFDPTIQNFVRAPELDDPSQSADFQSPDELARIAATIRGQDISAATARRGQDLDLATTQAQLGQRAYEFEQTQALAKEQWLFQKQNLIDQLNLQKEQLATTQAQNARMFVLEQQNLQFLQNKFAFESGLALRQEERATQAQLFGQQATVAGLQLEMEAITQQARNLQAQLNQEVAIFNAGKAADVSMFNIDQQTKTAMFNAEGAMQAAMFNEQMSFNVQQANVQNERLRQQQLQELAMSISDAAEDPGDRGKLASLILANSGFGAMDAAIAENDLRTADSMMPLEALLRQREDVMESEIHPFSFNPVNFTPVTAGQASFTPAQAAQVQMPNFSNVNMPTPNTTPFDPSSIPTSAPGMAPTPDSTIQNFIASGNTTASTGQQFHKTGGGSLTAEERAQMTQNTALRDLLLSQGLIPQMEEGGVVEGMFIAGDSSDGKENEEFIIPLGDGMTLILPKPKGKKGDNAAKGVKKFQDGGLFQNEGRSIYEGLLDDTDRTRAQNFLDEASRRATFGTPFSVEQLPTPVFASSPGTSRYVTDLLASLNAIARGVPQGFFTEQQQLLRPAGYSQGVIGRTR